MKWENKHEEPKKNKMDPDTSVIRLCPDMQIFVKMQERASQTNNKQFIYI